MTMDQAEQQTSRYRCRVHPDVPVSAKGAGCPACDQAAEPTRHLPRRARRLAAITETKASR